jgi:DNA-binding transcriptional LysR family regulator
MELRQLRHFIAVAQHRHFGRAAETLHITQQALSQSIAQMEKDVGAKLFERGQFGAELTEIGRAFEGRARLVVGELELATKEIYALAGGAKGHIRLGVSSVVASKLLPQVVDRFSRHRPLVGLSVIVDHSRELYDRLQRGDLEFLVSTPVAAMRDFPELEHDPIDDTIRFDANFLVMRSGHALLQIDQPTLADFRAVPWILPETLGAHARAITDLFHRHDLAPPDYILRTDSFFGAKAILAQTDFVALLGREAASVEIDAGILSGIPVPDYESTLPGYFIYRKRSTLQPAARELVRMFRTIIREQDVGAHKF